MSTIDFKDFDLEGLSLEEMEAVNSEVVKTEPGKVVVDAHENNKNVVKASTPEPMQVEESIQLVETAEQAENDKEQITCPKCELQQPKVEQCIGCGIYVEKAMAQIGQSKIQITATKF